MRLSYLVLIQSVAWLLMEGARTSAAMISAYFSWNVPLSELKGVYTLRTRQNGCHFPDDIFKWIFLNVNVPRCPINDILALVQVMALRWPGAKPLFEPMMISSLKYVCITRPQYVNTLRPRQDGGHFPDDVFKCIFVNENAWIAIKISLRFVPKGPINNILALVQIMALRWPDAKPLSEPMMISSLTYVCVTRPQWVKGRYVWVIMTWPITISYNEWYVGKLYNSHFFSCMLPNIIYQHGLTLIPAWIHKFYMPREVWDAITYPFLNFNSCTVEV